MTRVDEIEVSELRARPEESAVHDLDTLLVDETLREGLEKACSLAASMILQ
jgi:hypothetical protein